MKLPNDGLKKAIQHFWRTRTKQELAQGTKSGRKDAGARSAVTGGAQMNGFIDLFRDLLIDNGVPKDAIHTSSNTEIPGYFRPEKSWDLLVVRDGNLLASLEFKSQVGSFGNNYNNRTEEALGSATDVWTAYREGAFKPSQRPWLGYLMLLEEAHGSTRPVKPREPHFEVFPEFKQASYADRYQILLTKLLLERLYDGTCFLMSSREAGLKGGYQEPNEELNFIRFAQSLIARVASY